MSYFINEHNIRSYAGWEKINITYSTLDSPDAATFPTPLFVESENFYVSNWNVPFNHMPKIEIELEWADGSKISETVMDTEIFYMNSRFHAYPEIKYSLKDRVLIIKVTNGKYIEE